MNLMLDLRMVHHGCAMHTLFVRVYIPHTNVYTQACISSIVMLSHMLNRKVHKAAVLCMDCSAAKSLTTGSFDKQLRLFDTRGAYMVVCTC